MYRVMPWALPTIRGDSQYGPIAGWNYVGSVDGDLIIRDMMGAGGTENPYSVFLRLPVTYVNKDPIASFDTDFKLTTTTLTRKYTNTAGSVKTGSFTLSTTTPSLDMLSIQSNGLYIQYNITISEAPSDFKTGFSWSDLTTDYTLSKFTLYDQTGKAIQEISI